MKLKDNATRILGHYSSDCPELPGTTAGVCCNKGLFSSKELMSSASVLIAVLV